MLISSHAVAFGIVRRFLIFVILVLSLSLLPLPSSPIFLLLIVSLLARPTVMDPNIKPYYACKLSPRVGFFMTDNRVERSLHK